MKKLKTLALLLFAASLTLTACGDDDEDDVATQEIAGNGDGEDVSAPELTGKGITFSGNIVTKVCLNPESGEFVDYMNDNTDVTAKMEDDGFVTVVVKEMTGRPARGETPASMMTDITFRNVNVSRLDNGNYSFYMNGEDFAGIAGGTMDGAFKPYIQGSMDGEIVGKTLTLNITDYKFTVSPFEPVMRSVFTGTVKE